MPGICKHILHGHNEAIGGRRGIFFFFSEGLFFLPNIVGLFINKNM